MPVDSLHPDYEEMLPVWTRARDVLAGEDAVKNASEELFRCQVAAHFLRGWRTNGAFVD